MNRIRIAVRIVWKPGCTFGCTGAPTCTKINRVLHRPIPKLYSKFEVNRIRIAARIVCKPKGWKKERKKKKKKKKKKHGHFINLDLNTKYWIRLKKTKSLLSTRARV